MGLLISSSLALPRSTPGFSRLGISLINSVNGTSEPELLNRGASSIVNTVSTLVTFLSSSRSCFKDSNAWSEKRSLSGVYVTTSKSLLGYRSWIFRNTLRSTSSSSNKESADASNLKSFV